MRVGVIAGEASGDHLGAGMISALKDQHPAVQCAGIAGPRMIDAGCEPWFAQERLAVMGLSEILSHLPDLLKVRRGFLQRFSKEPCDVFVGIDAPDFNLPVEEKLRRKGVPTVQYVSPSVWAWRSSRIKKIARSADLVLCILPFEKAFYDKHGLAAKFVGHPLADELPMLPDQAGARTTLGFEQTQKVVAVLPGSRGGELKYLGPCFAATIVWLLKQNPDLKFVAPMATPHIRVGFRSMLESAGVLGSVQLLDGQAQTAMAAADVVLLASGTATLEALLLKKPHVVAYKVAKSTAWIVDTLNLMNIERFALSNLLADEDLVPEFMQDAVVPEDLGAALLEQLDDKDLSTRLSERFSSIHRELRRNANVEAAQGVLSLLGGAR